MIPSPHVLAAWRHVAHHEAAHAVVCLLLTGETGEICIAYDAEGRIRGRHHFSPTGDHEDAPDDKVAEALQDTCDSIRAIRGPSIGHWAVFSDQIETILAGVAFDLSVGLPAGSRNSQDRRTVLALAEALMPDRSSARRLLDYSLMRAARWVDENRQAIELLGDALAGSPRGYLDAGEIDRILRAADLFPVARELHTLEDSPAVNAVLDLRADGYLVGETVRL